MVKKIEVFDGCDLHAEPVSYPVGATKCRLLGSGPSEGKRVELD